MRTLETTRPPWIHSQLAGAALIGALIALSIRTVPGQGDGPDTYEDPRTRELVELVTKAAERIEREGEAAFDSFREPDSRWRRGDTYVFVLDLEGNMVVHADPTMEGKNQLGLEDVDGRPIVRGLIAAATAAPDRPEGWYHYEWPVPGGLLPRWKSSYVRLAQAPSSERYVVGSGVYDDRMERAFVVDMVERAVERVEQLGERAFPLFHDRTGPFIAKDAYVFVFDSRGIDRVNPAHPNLEGRFLLDVKDTNGQPFVREFFELAQTRGSGWVDYMWPKPGEAVSTRKSTYVACARHGERWFLVGCGVYLADAPKSPPDPDKLTADGLVEHVRAGAAVLERRGEDAFGEFREKGSKWFHGDTYFIVWRLDGTRVFHAADPSLEGKQASGATDVLGRPYGRMYLEVASSEPGEGWVHYMFPEPDSLFPAWKSVFVKRVTFPSGQQHLIACGIYDMQMDERFIVDVVDRASALVAARGKECFDDLRDKKGPFVFLDTYVFVNGPDGMELVNPAQPSLEGTSIDAVRDVNGKRFVHEYIQAAMKDGSAWSEYWWYRPGSNDPAPKRTYVRRVQAGDGTYIVGSGYYFEQL